MSTLYSPKPCPIIPSHTLPPINRLPTITITCQSPFIPSGEVHSLTSYLQYERPPTPPRTVRRSPHSAPFATSQLHDRFPYAHFPKENPKKSASAYLYHWTKEPSCVHAQPLVINPSPNTAELQTGTEFQEPEYTKFPKYVSNDRRTGKYEDCLGLGRRGRNWARQRFLEACSWVKRRYRRVEEKKVKENTQERESSPLMETEDDENYRIVEVMERSAKIAPEFIAERRVHFDPVVLVFPGMPVMSGAL